ncbi:MAG: hypothetical protein IT284_02080 [Bacteroidetes bacterium]|nr:hypothetical protein [Bacteroidota bacterium]
MQKIILSEKTIAIVVQRLKHFYRGVVKATYFDRDIPLADVVRGNSRHDPVIRYAGEVEVERWDADSLGYPHPASCVVRTDSGDFGIGENRTFYFIGNRTIVVMDEPLWGGLGPVKLDLVSSWRRLETTSDLFFRKVIEQGDKELERMRQKELDQYLMGDAADRVLERDY